MDSIGSFFQTLLVLLLKFWSDVVNGPQTLWQLTDGYPISRKILIGGAILAAVTILSLLIYYLSCIVRKKRENPMALIIVLAMVCAVFVLGARMKPSEAAPVTVDGVEILSCDSYSLSRGRLVFFPKGSVFFFEDSWFLADDTFSWMADDSTLVQLTGLRSLCSERIYTLDSADRGSGVPRIGLDCISYTENGSLTAELAVYILKDRTLEEEPWFLADGESVSAAPFYYPGYVEVTDYRILKNDGGTVTFFMTLQNRSAQPTAVCMARQYGPDIVVAASSAVNYGDDNHSDKPYKPDTDKEQLAFLLEPLQNLYDGGIRVIQDPTEEMLSLALPDRIRNRPPWLLDRGTRLTLPCSRLIEMTADELSFIGSGPDGSMCRYRLVNGRDSTKAKQWNRIYKLDKTAVDEAMSEFLGAKAALCKDGWVIKMGTYLGLWTDGYDHYYCLSYTPLPQSEPEPADVTEEEAA